ncbi:hypothetical protein ACMHYB_39030 [Sorangium sp. So ce1128]
MRSWGDISDGTTFTNRVRPGHVLFGKRRAYQRKVAVADFDAVCSGDIYLFESTDSSPLLPELLPFICQTDAFFDHAVGTSAGSLSPRTNWSSLVDWEFVVPPLDEQRRSLSMLSVVESILREVGNAARALELMARRLVEGFGLSRVKRVPAGTLLREPLVRGWSPTCNEEGRGYATLPAGCVYSGVVDLENNLKYAVIDESTYKRYQLRQRDVLVLRGNGNRELVGRAGVVAAPEPLCFYPDLLVRLRFDEDQLDPVVAVLIWNAVSVHSELIRRTKSSNGIYKLGFDDIREHMLPLPTRAQQVGMRNAASSWRSASEALKAREQEARKLKAAVVRETFRVT